jgi:hypothetical protein
VGLQVFLSFELKDAPWVRWRAACNFVAGATVEALHQAIARYILDF